MNELQRFHSKVKRRYHSARAIKNLLNSVGISVPRAYAGGADMTNKTYAIDCISRLIRDFGQDNVRLALRLLTETNDQNAKHIRASVITALTIICAKHDYGRLGLQLFDAMDRIDIGEQIAFARSLQHRECDHESGLLLGIIAAELRRSLGEVA